MNETTKPELNVDLAGQNERLVMWRDIESAPRDGTAILAWHADCGVFLARYSAMIDFMSDGEIELDIKEHNLDEETMEAYDWFCADFMTGSRLEGSEIPTKWIPLPDEPAT